jgi:hypothetical protein
MKVETCSLVYDQYIYMYVVLNVHIQIIIISIQPLGRFWQELEPSHVTGMALARCILGMFLGVVCHCFPLPLDVPTFAARCPHVPINASTPSSERWNCEREWSGDFAEMTPFLRHLGIFTCHKSATWGKRLYFPSEGRRAKDFFARKIRRLRPGANPLTTRPPRPLIYKYTTYIRVAVSELYPWSGVVNITQQF